MQNFLLRIEPLSAFGTPLKGDTLFGQLCWAVRNRLGETALDRLLKGYLEGRPFAVVSDAFPQGFAPRPALPSRWFAEPEGADRKDLKRRIWMPLEALDSPLTGWLGHCRTPSQLLAGEPERPYAEAHTQPHNSISRLTGTTGGDGFAPYTSEQTWYRLGTVLECHVVLDETRLDETEFGRWMSDVGTLGFGRDASAGLGKFRLAALERSTDYGQEDANACLTLAPCAPPGQGVDPARSYYQTFTRFGRHGDVAVHHGGRPFKNPILLAQTGAVFPVPPPSGGFFGQGLGGDGRLSKAVHATVHQGYAPVIPIHLPDSPERAP